ncbi:hypothetical protein TNCT_628241 [Trichonephila clavata]|uniref:Uncharacterized protein n=1 Tax=Trichonephila clavata TaxID=2740835 RepID=A0A8X6K148_TRICU|nr:hypothetical protein TNCT_628241 [Trichonephila clavata]
MDDLEQDLFLKLDAWFSGLCRQFESYCLYYLKANAEKNVILKILSESSPFEELSSERRIVETILLEFNNAEKIKERVLETQKNTGYSFHDERYLFADMDSTEENDLPHIPLVIRTLTLKMETLEDLLKDYEECFLEIRKLISDFWEITELKQNGVPNNFVSK